MSVYTLYTHFNIPWCPPPANTLLKALTLGTNVTGHSLRQSVLLLLLLLLLVVVVVVVVVVVLLLLLLLMLGKLRTMKTWPWKSKISGSLTTYLYTPGHLSGGSGHHKLSNISTEYSLNQKQWLGMYFLTLFTHTQHCYSADVHCRMMTVCCTRLASHALTERLLAALRVTRTLISFTCHFTHRSQCL